MVSTLDATTLTSKLVPLLAKIKTKEPAVTMATLSVHEAMGQKVSLEAIATLVLPQLWVMAMGPCKLTSEAPQLTLVLNTDQFARFMSVIQSLGARVEREHSQHLREVRKMEEQTASMHVSNGDNPFDFSGQTQEVDFETLVKGGTPSGSTPAAATTADPWDMDSWGNDDLVSQRALRKLILELYPRLRCCAAKGVHSRPGKAAGKHAIIVHGQCVAAAEPKSAARFFTAGCTPCVVNVVQQRGIRVTEAIGVPGSAATVIDSASATAD